LRPHREHVRRRREHAAGEPPGLQDPGRARRPRRDRDDHGRGAGPGGALRRQGRGRAGDHPGRRRHRERDRRRGGGADPRPAGHAREGAPRAERSRRARGRAVTAIAYHRPESVEAACRLLAEFGRRARLVAGGTALTILLKEGLLDADQLVSLDRVPLAAVAWTPGAGGGTLAIGAMVTHQALVDGPLVRAHLPVLAQVLAQVASRRIRNVATIGGNLCWAEAASDPPGLLMALGAEVTARSVRGERRLPVRALFRDYFTTTLEPDEVLTEVRVPAPPADAGVAYVKFTPQSKADKPVLAVTAL